LEAASSILLDRPPAPLGEAGSPGIEGDPRWRLTQHVLGSRQFARSPLLSRFLQYVVTETLEGRHADITEHQIGVQVFGRPANYRTVEDNIVRNYARQLRKRLAEHFSDHPEERTRIEIPVGGYVPHFAVQDEKVLPADGEADEDEMRLSAGIGSAIPGAVASRFGLGGRVLAGALLAAWSVVLVLLTWWMASGHKTRVFPKSPGEILWGTLLNGAKSTYVVPPDAGLNLVEDLAHHPLPLAEYIQGGYMQLPLSKFDQHSADDLRMHQFTDFVDMEIVVALSRLPEYNPQRVSLRFPRDLRLDDLKYSNAVIIGSLCSNPWASLANANANFTIVCSEGMQSSMIVNKKPQPGEQAVYASHWNEPTHTTYALLSLFPNLSGSGHILFLEGLDVAGTQAAAEALLQTSAIAPILKRATRADGSLAPFEVLLRSTSIQSNATDTQVIAYRVAGQM
jgi:hypothetical protein